MQRDWDLIQRIMTMAENKPPGQLLMHSEIDGYESQIVSGHIALLADSGYLKAHAVKGRGLVLLAHVSEITMKGYDLLDTMRSKPLWEKIKQIAKDKGVELTFDVIKKLGGIAMEQLLN